MQKMKTLIISFKVIRKNKVYKSVIVEISSICNEFRNSFDCFQKKKTKIFIFKHKIRSK